MGTFGDLGISGRLSAFCDPSFASVNRSLHFGDQFSWMRETLLSAAAYNIHEPLLPVVAIFSYTGVLIRLSSGSETSVRLSLRIWWGSSLWLRWGPRLLLRRGVVIGNFGVASQVVTSGASQVVTSGVYSLRLRESISSFVWWQQIFSIGSSDGETAVVVSSLLLVVVGARWWGARVHFGTWSLSSWCVAEVEVCRSNKKHTLDAGLPLLSVLGHRISNTFGAITSSNFACLDSFLFDLCHPFHYHAISPRAPLCLRHRTLTPRVELTPTFADPYSNTYYTNAQQLKELTHRYSR